MEWRDWYNSLEKPSWTPEPATIGLIWQILYPIILVTFGFVFVQAIRKKVPWMVALPFAINLVANLIFTPIQFGLRNLPLAAVDILIVWGTIIWMMVGDLEALPLGGRRSGAVLRLGVDCDRAATVDHLVELVNFIIRHDFECMSRSAVPLDFTATRGTMTTRAED